MPNAFDDLMAEAADAGVDSEWIDKVKKASAGSPLRQELESERAARKALEENAAKYRDAALNSQFAQLGIKVKPDALKVPEDLDPLDGDKVRDWAVTMGLAEAPQAVTPQEQAAHERIANASAGADAGSPSSARDEVLQAATPEEFFAKAQAYERARGAVST